MYSIRRGYEAFNAGDMDDPHRTCSDESASWHSAGEELGRRRP